MLVFIHHMLTPVLFGGAVGVDIFFVLSGYLITSILLREYDRTGGVKLKRFYLRRLVRLYPALLLALTVVFLPGLLFAPVQRVWLIDNLLAVTYTTPIAREIGWTFSKAWGHTWTLGIEEMFYLIWPALLLFLFRKFGPGRIATVAVGATGATMMAANVAIELSTGHPSELLRAGGLFIGCTMAFVLSRRKSAFVPKISASVGVVLIALAVAYRTANGPLSVAVLATTVGSVLLIASLGISTSGVEYRILATRPMVYIGRISYELYLWHYPVMIVLGWAMGKDPIQVAWIAAPLSVALAAGSHRVLAPAIDRWKHRIS